MTCAILSTVDAEENRAAKRPQDMQPVSSGQARCKRPARRMRESQTERAGPGALSLEHQPAGSVQRCVHGEGGRGFLAFACVAYACILILIAHRACKSRRERVGRSAGIDIDVNVILCDGGTRAEGTTSEAREWSGWSKRSAGCRLRRWEERRAHSGNGQRWTRVACSGTADSRRRRRRDWAHLGGQMPMGDR